MTFQRRSTVRQLGAATVIGVVLVSCGGGSDDSAARIEPVAESTSTTSTSPLPADTPGTSAASPASTSTTTTAAPSATPAPAPAPTTAAPEEGACLVGNWVVTDEQMNAFYAGLMSTVEAPLTMTSTGSAALNFNADGTYGWVPAFTLVVEVAGQRGEGITSGTIDGDWAASDGVVATASDVNALDVSVTVSGVTFGGSDLANGLLNSSPVNGVTYSCGGPSPVLDFKTADPGVTVPITLTPA